MGRKNRRWRKYADTTVGQKLIWSPKIWHIDYAGEQVEGNKLDVTKYRSFVGYYEMPQRHGLTMGELALLKGKARDKKNPKGYIINSIKGKLNDKK